MLHHVSSIFLPSRTCKSQSKKENKKGSSGCSYLWQPTLFSFLKTKRNRASLPSSLVYGTLLFLNTTHPSQLYSLLSFLKFSALAFCPLSSPNFFLSSRLLLCFLPVRRPTFFPSISWPFMRPMERPYLWLPTKMGTGAVEHDVESS